MEREKARRIIKIYNWTRVVLLIGFFVFMCVGLMKAHAQNQTVPDSIKSSEERLTFIEGKIADMEKKYRYIPKVSGVIRGKYELSTLDGRSRFEIRNARFAIKGKLPLCSSYKFEVDFCDETAIKFKAAWAAINPWRTLRLSVGYQRMPFSIDAHRGPSTQYFSNRSFIAKQVGDVRDVGFNVGYDFVTKKGRNFLTIDAGVYNGSDLDNQKFAWFRSPAYSARIIGYPIEGLGLVPSVQHQNIAEGEASYTSVDMGVFWEFKGLRLEAEYLRKFYSNGAFDDCSAANAMVIYKHKIKREKCFIESLSYMGRYDFMQDHTSGKNGFVMDDDGNPTSRLELTDAERHRMTIGVNIGIRNPYFLTAIRVNYEKYWYPHSGAKEYEQDKLVCELVIGF